ncbi:MAG: DnaJ domain-containing protein [Cyanobacteria bacterium RI_101]|nr:DnaJ domain-containing protein [Cyanobacteria bacterium RI_101]
MEDYYKILGISVDASQEMIQKAYHRQAKNRHPDRPGGSTQAMQQLNEAYEILKDPQKRAIHDKSRSANATNETIKNNFKNQQRARSVSNQYPKKWEDFQRWMYEDFKKANYDPTGIIGTGSSRTPIPTGGDSLSAMMFIGAGGFLGVLLSFNLVGFPLRKPDLMLYTGLAAGGAWAGAGIHRLISDDL